ncbi:MAG: D-TA family PLP-dependent enzyme [Opitutaceae bacterium]|nr:D-TA family PLP-dependent enzyme [Opitutaceae bacterium]
MMNYDWMRLADEAVLPSPSLLVFPDRVEENLRRMIAIVGGLARLRPHVKTHKLPQIVARQVALGVTKCKCATIAEAEMAAGAGVTDVLLATQPVGPNGARLLALKRAFPGVKFSTIADDPGVVAALDRAACEAGATIEVFIDLDVGMGRTGIAPGPGAVALYRAIVAAPGLRAGGLHAYDGQLRQASLAERSVAAAEGIARTDALRAELLRLGLPVPCVVAGGTPGFPIHARRPEVECSPGTCVLWDANYAGSLPDLDFLNAAVLFTRVISRPGVNRLCLDLGHKAVASEMPHPRVVFPALPDARAVTHSEEHLVIETARAAEFPVGAGLYGLPWHICPTVALHDCVRVVRGGQIAEEWTVTARARRLSV